MNAKKERFLRKYDIIEMALLIDIILQYKKQKEISIFKENTKQSLINVEEILHKQILSNEEFEEKSNYYAILYEIKKDYNFYEVFEHIRLYTNEKRNRYDFDDSNYDNIMVKTFQDDIKDSGFVNSFEKIFETLLHSITYEHDNLENKIEEKVISNMREKIINNHILLSILEAYMKNNKIISYNMEESLCLLTSIISINDSVKLKTKKIKTSKYSVKKQDAEILTYMEIVQRSTECLNLILNLLPLICFDISFEKTSFFKIKHFFEHYEEKSKKEFTIERFEKFLYYEINDCDEIRDAVISLYEIANMANIIEIIG